MTIRWGRPVERQPLKLTDRAWALIAGVAALVAVFTLPTLFCELCVYVMEAF